MKIYNLFNTNYNNRMTFKGCDISKISREVASEHVKAYNLSSHIKLQVSDMTLKGTTDKVMNNILKIHEKYKNGPKYDVIVEEWQNPNGELFEKGHIQARWVEKGSTPDPTNKVVARTNDSFNLYSRLAEYVPPSEYQ